MKLEKSSSDGQTQAVRRSTVAGWGRYPRGSAAFWRPEKLSELMAAVRASEKPVLARGMGRAYGDAALNDDGSLIDMTRLNRMLDFDPQTGYLRCEAGVTFAEVLETFVPRGFFPPVTPGSKFITLGGALAADIHGKNHHRDSSISRYVRSFELMGANGEVKRCAREENADLFWATLGGMGLTGVIVELTLELARIESAYLECESLALPDIDRALEVFEENDRRYNYSVAWIDCAARSKQLGRSIATFANFATADRLPLQVASQPLFFESRKALKVPFGLPRFVLTPLTIRGFNALYYYLHRNDGRERIVHLERFFYPLDQLDNWNRLYGRRGFAQYQCVLPLAESRAGIIELFEELKRSRISSSLAVLKQFGPQEGMLSFPMPGYTLAMDFAVQRGLGPLIERLDQVVLRRGGRIYLAKDAFARPQTVRQMYPNLERWQKIKASVDPECVFSSRLSRRLGLDPDTRRADRTAPL